MPTCWLGLYLCSTLASMPSPLACRHFAFLSVMFTRALLGHLECLALLSWARNLIWTVKNKKVLEWHSGMQHKVQESILPSGWNSLGGLSAISPHWAGFTHGCKDLGCEVVLDFATPEKKRLNFKYLVWVYIFFAFALNIMRDSLSSDLILYRGTEGSLGCFSCPEKEFILYCFFQRQSCL